MKAVDGRGKEIIQACDASHWATCRGCRLR